MTEAQLQMFVVELLTLKAHRGVLFFSVPNEGKREARGGARLKKMGMLPGVSDLVIISDGRAMFLELKTPAGRMSDAQQAFREKCGDLMLPYQVARTPEDAIRILTGWRVIDDA